jgi:hypothetical protein
MADITMCKNTECELKDTCYRFLAKANEYWQSYAKFEPVYNIKLHKHECEHYWEINNDNDKNLK